MANHKYSGRTTFYPDSVSALTDSTANWDDVLGQEKLDGLDDNAWRILYVYHTTVANKEWDDIIKNSVWVRSARFRFTVESQASAAKYTVDIRCANYENAPEDWNTRFLSWTMYDRSPGDVWQGLAPNAEGPITGKIEVGPLPLGHKDACVKSVCRQHMRYYQSQGTHFDFGFSLQAQSETSVLGNLVRISDEEDLAVEDRPYIRVTWGQPAITRIRGFGKRMLTRL